MFITAMIHAISAFAFKIAMATSHLHYELSWIFFDPTAIWRHYQYGALFKVTRPYLAWNPIA
jgi:hypothetical protein